MRELSAVVGCERTETRQIVGGACHTTLVVGLFPILVSGATRLKAQCRLALNDGRASNE